MEPENSLCGSGSLEFLPVANLYGTIVVRYGCWLAILAKSWHDFDDICKADFTRENRSVLISGSLESGTERGFARSSMTTSVRLDLHDVQLRSGSLGDALQLWYTSQFWLVTKGRGCTRLAFLFIEFGRKFWGCTHFLYSWSSSVTRFAENVRGCTRATSYFDKVFGRGTNERGCTRYAGEVYGRSPHFHVEDSGHLDGLFGAFKLFLAMHHYTLQFWVFVRVAAFVLQ